MVRSSRAPRATATRRRADEAQAPVSPRALRFDGRADACFVPGARVAQLARAHGCSERAVVRHGLPLRDAFAAHAADADAAPPASDALADAERAARRAALGVRAPARPAALIVGGGEGMGGREAIVDAAWAELDGAGLAATLVVVSVSYTHLTLPTILLV